MDTNIFLFLLISINYTIELTTSIGPDIYVVPSSLVSGSILKLAEAIENQCIRMCTVRVNK